jgi:hypothetical protein
MKEIRNQRTPPCKKIENVNISLSKVYWNIHTISRRRVYRLPLASSLHLLFLLAVEQQSEKGLYFCLKRIVAKQHTHTHKNKRKAIYCVVYSVCTPFCLSCCCWPVQTENVWFRHEEQLGPLLCVCSLL